MSSSNVEDKHSISSLLPLANPAGSIWSSGIPGNFKLISDIKHCNIIDLIQIH